MNGAACSCKATRASAWCTAWTWSLLLQQVEAGTWQPVEMDFAAMPARFGYVLKPLPAGAG